MERNLKNQKDVVPPFLKGGGEMGRLTREFSWNNSSLGHPSDWPQSLKTTLGLLLHSSFPMFLFWGEELLCFYNDAFRPSLGQNGKHPAVGKPAEEVWPEIWNFIGPLIDQVMKTGDPVWFEDRYLPIFRNGALEDVHWTFSYSPAYGDDGEITGVFVTCSETTAKVNAFRSLEESNNRFRNFIAQATVGIIIVTGDEMIVEVANDAYGKLVNRSARQLIGNRLFDVIPEAEQQFRPVLESVSSKGEPLYLFERHFFVYTMGKRVDGFLDIVYHPFRDDKGAVTGVMILCQDVTEKVLSKRKIRESEQRFQAAVAAVEGIVWTNNTAGEMVGIQKGWESLTGQSFEEYQGYGWASAVHPEDAQPTIEAWNEAVQQKKTFVFQHRVRTKNGEWRHFSVRAIPLLNPDGSIREWVGVHTDITELYSAEQELRESEERFRSIADQSPMIVYIVEPGVQASMGYFNKTWLDYTGQTFEEAIGRAWDGIVHPDDVTGVLETYEDAYAKRKSYTLPAVRLRRHDGEYRWHLFKGSPRYLPNGEFYGYVGVGIDIHDQKLSELALKKNEENLERLVRERTSQLERSNEDLLQFAHVASHDLKEPVRKIMTFTNRIKEDGNRKLTAEDSLYLDKVQSAARRMSSMIDGVLLYSTMNSSQQPVEQVDLNQIVRDIRNDLEVFITQKNAVLETGILPVIEGASVLLHQLFYNLINNSLKFTDPGRTQLIKIVAENIERDNEPYVSITLSDTGIGFEQSYADIIFNTFTRLNSKDKYEGTGLGLALCRKIVLRHGGTIEARGEPGIGATFIVTLPLLHRRSAVV